MSETDHQSAYAFGLQFNQSYVLAGKRGMRPSGCPEWANPRQVDDWKQRGIVMWQGESKRLVVLSAVQSVEYLDRLRGSAAWQTDGITITRRVYVGRISVEKPKRSRKKKGEESPPPEPEKKPGLEPVDEEIMRLDPEQARQLLGLLQHNEGALRRMAEAEKKDAADRLHQVYSMLLEHHRVAESEQFKWADRPMRWVKDDTQKLWTCDLPPNRAKVFCAKDHFFWEVCIARPAPGKPGYNHFLQLEEAVTWAEEQLRVAAEAATEAKEEADQAAERFASRPKMDLAPYRIEPSALEPERITYRVVIEFETVPDSYKTMELLCGGELQYDKRYPSVHKLAMDLQIDDAQFELEQPVGPNDEWNRGHSTVTYYRESVAVEQAQVMWNKSRIVEYFRRGKLVHARYGVQEVETKYTSWLGACEHEDKPWGKEYTRAEYMAEQADILTLANALDVDGFRAFLGVDLDTMDDERLLASLHRRRVESQAIPSAARSESQRWLKEHDHARKRRYGER